MRKPIQIAALRFARSDDNGGPDSIETEVVALCDDGTIWTMFGTTGDWVALPKIPQNPVLEDWLDEVAIQLPRRAIRRDAVERLMAEHRSLLVGKYNDGETAVAAVEALVARLG
jgi:hypothetical protein